MITGVVKKDIPMIDQAEKKSDLRRCTHLFFSAWIGVIVISCIQGYLHYEAWDHAT